MRLLTCALIVFLATPVSAARYAVTAGKPNRVVFVSKAATESFEGKTDQLSGSITVDPAAVGDSVVVNLAVDLASLDTGIGKRNQHMRENHLETAKFPTASFSGATVLSPRGAVLTAGQKVTLELDGSFTLHGVTKRLRVRVDVTPSDERTLAFTTTFKVPLADYAISRPKFLFLKLGEVQEVTVSGVAVLAP